MRRKLERSDLLFLDPDNGLEPAGFHPTAAKSGKSIMISELHQLARPGRCLIVYHHQSRRKGGHHAEMQHWADRLRASGFATVDALRADRFRRGSIFCWMRPHSFGNEPSRSRRIGRIALRGIPHHTSTQGISARSACWNARIRMVILELQSTKTPWLVQAGMLGAATCQWLSVSCAATERSTSRAVTSTALFKRLVPRPCIIDRLRHHPRRCSPSRLATPRPNSASVVRRFATRRC